MASSPFIMEDYRMQKILLDVALILIATRVGGMISHKFKMPEVLGALVAGIILGPSVFNLVQYNEGIELLSNLGVIFLMFLAGLETDLDKLKKSGISSLMIGSTGILVPLVLGTLGAFLFFSNTMENLFLGVILTATSVSITVETLAELGKLNSVAGINILGAAVVDDVLGLLLVSILLSANGNSTGGSVLGTIVKIGIFLIVSLSAVVFLPKILNRLAVDLKPGKSMLTFTIAVILIIAFISENFGIAAITGSYLCGVLFSQLKHKDYINRNIRVISSGFLSPAFFASVGLEVSFSGFTMRTFEITLMMFVIAVIGKVVGCGGAARMFRMKRSEALQIGTGMISRGEVAIITANIGLQNHIISQEIFMPTLLVVLLTTVAAPIFLKLVFSHQLDENIDREGRIDG